MYTADIASNDIMNTDDEPNVVELESDDDIDDDGDDEYSINYDDEIDYVVISGERNSSSQFTSEDMLSLDDSDITQIIRPVEQRSAYIV
jgi:hypothetical protein